MLPTIDSNEEGIVLSYKNIKPKDFPFTNRHEVRLEFSETEKIIKALEIIYDKITLSHIMRDMFYLRYNSKNNLYTMIFEDHGEIYFKIIFDRKEKEKLIESLHFALSIQGVEGWN